MLASSIIKRARSLSDTPTSTFVSHDDEINSLHEAYKDIYSKITDSSDDYYITDAIINTSTAVKLGENEWEVTIPVDVYKIRFVDCMDNGRWSTMQKFNTNNRNRATATPQYRWRGNKLWITSSAYIGLPASIRLAYYPPPITPSVPEITKLYGLAYAQYLASLITSPQYFSVDNPNISDATDWLIYIYNGTDIRIESKTLAITRILYVSTGLSNVAYHLGYIYFLKSGSIMRASTDLIATITPSSVISSATITSFTISNNMLYYSDGTNTKIATLAGASAAVLYAYTSKCAAVIGTSLYYIKLTDGFIYKNATSTGIAATYLTGDGLYLYYLDSLGVLHKYTDTTDEILSMDIAYIGTPFANYMAYIDKNIQIGAMSTLSDTDFSYPLNESNEILAYQSAIDYKRKQNGDTAPLQARLAEIYDRFMDVLKRDEYQPERRSPEAPTWNY